jgi:glycine/D-amino acid oxidase-like deaminating enzyme
MKLRVAIFGAGAFGGWTALELARRGAEVRLIDAWGAGNARASSGGDTRVIRAPYGSHEIYTRMAVRALGLWRAHEQRFHQDLLRITGALWMFTRDDPFVGNSSAALGAHGLTLDELTVHDARRRYPQIDFTGIASLGLEPEAGYLFARRACEHVVTCVAAEGGRYSQAAARGPLILDGPVRAIPLSDGTAVGADAFVFACGPWLGSLFPDVIGPLVSATRQEVYYFGPPAGDSRFTDERLPVWLELGERFIYGIPGTSNSGFKVADDSPGPLIDPTTADRSPTPEGIRDMSGFLARRFPGLSGAPLIRSEVCQYESTPDANFIIDRHPRAPNVWIAGGGSGHGFKMGPAIGERVASLVLGEAELDPAFALLRLAAPPAVGWRPKWS